MKQIRIYGIVQGVGFRPFVARTALRDKICGVVSNKGSYVEIFCEGSEEGMQRFLREFDEHPPVRSVILKIAVRDVQERMAKDLRQSYDFSTFTIIDSVHEEGDIFVSPDIATCPTCEREMRDPKNRRYLHPFINCTACGPRLTILDAMPYDRERTSMKDFPMCPACAKEYYDPATRRFDAQPVCCPDCGPVVRILDTEICGDEAITLARKAIRDGKILAIKGIGGYHLCVNAADNEAVEKLRLRKHRPVKPFAVMMKDLATVRRECVVTPEDEKVLTGYQKPIYLLERKEANDSAAEGPRLSEQIAPGNPKVGVMLPYTPLHSLLFDYPDDVVIGTDLFVMTSGNISGAAICRTDEDVREQLSEICDLVLTHDRTIRLRADDTVLDSYRGEPYMIRRSRGFAPVPVMLPQKYEACVLGIGGELKNTFCIGKGDLLYPSPYVGDLGDIRTVKALSDSVVRMEELLEAKPSLVVCDLHPSYNSTEVAEHLGRPVLKIQHHYAHIASCMAENGTDETVIGLSFDGTGYGTDATIWGGEILLADLDGFTRIGSMMPFLHVGGDKASREGYRIAASMLHSLYGEDAEEIAEKLGLCRREDMRLIGQMAEKKIHTIVSTSMGRLFDAVSAVLGLVRISTFEGEAANALMFAAQYAQKDPQKEKMTEALVASYLASEELLLLQTKEPETKEAEDTRKYLFRTDRLFSYITQAYLNGEDREILAYLFHRILGEMAKSVCLAVRKDLGDYPVALSGGVFQNTCLLGICEDSLGKEGFSVLRHHQIPPNDGGIGLGQAYVGLHRLQKR